MIHCPSNKIKFMNICINNFDFFMAIINILSFIIIMILVYKNNFYNNNNFNNDELICTVKPNFIKLSDLNKYYNNAGFQVKNNNNKKKLKNNNNNKKKIKSSNNNSNNNNNTNFNNEKNPLNNNLKCNICGMNAKISYHTINKIIE